MASFEEVFVVEDRTIIVSIGAYTGKTSDGQRWTSTRVVLIKPLKSDRQILV